MMDLNQFTLALKLISDEYKLSDKQVTKISRRMLADETEFEKVWSTYKNRDRSLPGGVDSFRELLSDLLT